MGEISNHRQSRWYEEGQGGGGGNVIAATPTQTLPHQGGGLLETIERREHNVVNANLLTSINLAENGRACTILTSRARGLTWIKALIISFVARRFDRSI